MRNEKASPGASGEGQPPRDIVPRTHDFALRAIKLCVFLDEKPGVCRVLMPQILRAGTSVPSNVEEARAAQSKPDFIGTMNIALKEARETNFRLRAGGRQAVASLDSGIRRNHAHPRGHDRPRQAQWR